MTLQSLLHLQTNRDGVISRRSFLRNVAVGGAAGLGMLSWKDAVALQAEELRKRGMACILLFMSGGPSQLETFDPKPDTKNGGPTKAMPTAASGIHIAEGWNNVAKLMNDIAVIRSMTNKEGAHPRAQYQLHTGYVPLGAVKYPTLGSIVAAELGDPRFDLPNFVSISGGGPAMAVANIGSGFLGVQAAPFVVANPLRLPNNVELPKGVTDQRFGRRLDVLQELEQEFAEAGGKVRVEDHKTVYENASRLVRSPRLKAFDVGQEPEALRERYGRTPFGQGCLLARRLIEQGVTFVEVESFGWDTHLDNFNRVAQLRGAVDPAFGTLVADLKERGMLDKTLVIWMGEFGRTPRINPRTGRDHYPRAFNVALAGAGIKGGRVVGSTSADGMDVAERPVTVPDLFCTFCQALKINPRKENISSLGRPIKIVDGGEPVKELFV
jgi:uncharacterized protein (DUF1501 family)